PRGLYPSRPFPLVPPRTLRCNASMRHAMLLSLILAGATLASAQTSTPATPRPTQTPTPAAPRQGGTPTPRPTATPAAPRQAAPAPAPATTPRPAAPAAPRAAQPAARSGIALTVTDPSGFTLPAVRVELIGNTERNGETNASGQANFPGLQAGTYRLRFS